MEVEMSDFREFITIEPGVRLGKPIVRGTRITVDDVLDYLRSGMAVEEIVHDFPELTPAAIQACHDFEAARKDRTITVEAKVKP
jgi:uncharacterized protein (DUF433 family)